jgi:hypothetical protein
MKWLTTLISSEPVAFWSAFVAVALSAADEYGLPLQPGLKHLIALAVIAGCAFVARSQATPAKPPVPSTPPGA